MRSTRCAAPRRTGDPPIWTASLIYCEMFEERCAGWMTADSSEWPECEEDISVKRLEAVPWTAFCLE